MSKVNMPEPVAWHINKENRKEGFFTDNVDEVNIHINLSARYKGISVEPLITTAQAQAYKDACVREALEKAALNADQQDLANENNQPKRKQK